MSHSSLPLPLLSGGRRLSTLYPQAHPGEQSLLKQEQPTVQEVDSMLTHLAGLTLQQDSKVPSNMQPLSPTPVFSQPQESLQQQQDIPYLQGQEHTQKEGENIGYTLPIQVRHHYPFPIQGEELLEKVHSLRLLYPMHPEGLQASQILDMEKTFREYPYPWLTTLLMREVVQQYCPLKENRKDMPSMATLMIPSIKSILYQETDCFPQSLPEGWTQQLVRVGRDIGHPMEKLSLTDHLLQTLEDILIDRAAKTPEYMQELVEHVIAADNIKSGRMLRWLSCDETNSTEKCGTELYRKKVL